MISVNRPELVKAIAKAEKYGPLPNLNCLWMKAAGIYNQEFAIPGELNVITFSVVCLRTKEWSIPHLTLAGKKGRVGGFPTLNRGQRIPRREKFQKNPEAMSAFADMKSKAPTGYVELANRIATTGSKSLALKMVCLQCTNYQRAEIRDCNITHCVLWNFRPFQKGNDEDVPNVADKAFEEPEELEEQVDLTEETEETDEEEGTEDEE